jgi:hypothetical protein
MVNFRLRQEGPRTIFGGRVSEVHTSHFVLGTGGARFFFADGVPRPRLNVADNVTVKAVRIGSKYFAETIALDRKEDGFQW